MWAGGISSGLEEREYVTVRSFFRGRAPCDQSQVRLGLLIGQGATGSDTGHEGAPNLRFLATSPWWESFNNVVPPFSDFAPLAYRGV